MSFPNGLVPTTERVHPTPIYEFLAALVIAHFLWHIGKRAVGAERPAGEVFGYFLIFTGISRFLVEFIRINPRSFLGMTNAQVASVLSIAGGILLLVIISRPSQAPRPTSGKSQSKSNRIVAAEPKPTLKLENSSGVSRQTAA
jgi:phosphatidylglycerol:prolipoprotein diacylglycerol transferase